MSELTTPRRRRSNGALRHVTRDRVVVDYSSRRSATLVFQRLLYMTRSIEGRLMRPFAPCDPCEIVAAFVEAELAGALGSPVVDRTDRRRA